MCWCLKLYIYIMDGVVFDIWKFYLQTQKNKTIKKTQLFKKKRETKDFSLFSFLLLYYYWTVFFLLIQLEINKSKQWIQISSFSLHLENFKIGRRIYKNTNKFSQNLFSYINQKIKKSSIWKKEWYILLALFFYM